MERDRSRVLRASLGAASLVVTVFFGVMVIWPLARIGSAGLLELGPGGVVAILRRGSLLRVLRFTLLQASLSVVVSVGLGVPLAHVLTRLRVPVPGLWRGLITLPFVLPTLVVAGAIRGSQFGWFDGHPLASILWAHTFFNLAVVVRVVGSMMSAVDSNQSELARLLGCGPLEAWRRTVLPQLLPAIVGSALIVFLFCFTSYGVILVLGGPAVATIETEIRRYAIFRNELDVAAVLTLIQMGFVVLVSIASARLRRTYQGRRRAASPRRPIDSASARLLVGGTAAVTSLVVVWPMVSVVWRSLRVGAGIGFGNYRALAEPNRLLPTTAVRALGTSVYFGLLAAVIGATIALLASFVIVHGGRVGRVFELLVLVPLGLSAVALGFGYILTFTALDLRRSTLLIPVAHAVVGIPFVMAALVPVWRSVSSSELEAARSLGASGWRVFSEIEWPRLRRAVWVGGTFAFSISVGEFGATSFLARGESTFTAPMAIFRLLGQPGSQTRGESMALCVLLGAGVATATVIGDASDRSDRSRSWV